MKRAEWIDSCRFFAIFVIMVTHFIDKVSPALLQLWELPPTSWILYGLTGKFSVAFFFVFLGYFASKPASFSFKSIIRYSTRRYFQFAFYIFIVSTLYIFGSYCVTWLFHSSDDCVMRVISDGFKYNLVYLLHDSFLFEANYNATLWCMQQLFLASLICRGLAYIPEKLSIALRFLISLALILAMMAINANYCVWICAAILGYILRLLLELSHNFSKLRSTPLLIICLLTALTLIKMKMPESVLQYSLQSLAAFMLIYVQFNLPPIQMWLSKKPFPWLGSISIGLFVIHTPINALIYSSIYSILLNLIPKSVTAFICFIISFATCIALSWILKVAYEYTVKILRKEKLSV